MKFIAGLIADNFICVYKFSFIVYNFQTMLAFLQMFKIATSWFNEAFLFDLFCFFEDDIIYSYKLLLIFYNIDSALVFIILFVSVT